VRALFAVPLATLRTPLLAGLVALLLSGCASLTGSALYSYERSGPEACTLKVDTGRVLDAGVSVKLNECNVTVSAGKVESGGNTAKDVLDLLREVKKTPEK